MKPIIGIILVIGIIFVAANINNFSVREGGLFSAVLFATTTSCTDSDGADIFNKGYVNTGSGDISDFCWSGNQVMEMSCENDVRKATIYSCPDQCSDGACVSGMPPPPPSGQCVSDADCCTGPDCGVGRLDNNQELAYTFCSFDDHVYAAYHEWTCEAGQCIEDDYHGSKLVETCDFGCEELSDTEAQCIQAETCTIGDVRNRHCDPDLPNQEFLEICSDGRWTTYSQTCSGDDICEFTRCGPPPCQDECIPQTVCAGTYLATCKDWDGDGCTESPSSSQLVLCPQGCSNGQCEEIVCSEGDVGQEYCSGDRIVQAYNYLSGGACQTGTRTVTDCGANNQACVQQEISGVNVVQCQVQECADIPNRQCAGDLSGVLTYTTTAYPDCSITETLLPCPSGQECSPSTFECEAEVPPPEYDCSVLVSPISIGITEDEGYKGTVQSIVPTFSIVSISPQSKIIKQYNPAIVRLRQTITEPCDSAYTRIRIEQKDVQTGTHINTFNVQDWLDADGNGVTISPESCADGMLPIDYTLEFTSDMTTLFDFQVDIACDGATEKRISQETDTFSIIVESGVAPPSGDACAECSDGLFGWCTRNECYDLGACEWTGGFINLPFGAKCIPVDDFTRIPCNDVSDCPAPRCVHEDLGDPYGAEILMDNPSCVENTCRYEELTSCEAEGQVCSDVTRRCEAVGIFSFCDGNKICDSATWSPSVDEWICPSPLRDCDQCIQQSGSITDQFTSLQATCLGGPPPIGCGNNFLNDDEECDGDNFRIQSCVALDSDRYESGDLLCTDDCKFETDECVSAGPVCGDNDRDSPEDCDGTDLRNKECTDFIDTQGNDFVGGTLSCYSPGHSKQCEWDKRECESGIPPQACTVNGGTVSDAECVGGTDGRRCDDGVLIGDQACCATGYSLDSNTNICEEDTVCDSGIDTIICENGQEKTCTNDVWVLGRTCADTSQICTIGLGCVDDPTCQDDSDCIAYPATCSDGSTIATACINGECRASLTDCVINPCLIDPCGVDTNGVACDRTNLTEVCGFLGENNFRWYDNVCEATEDDASTVDEEGCRAVTCPTGQVRILDTCVSNFVIVGAVVLIGILAIFGGSIGGAGGKSSTRIIRG